MTDKHKVVDYGATTVFNTNLQAPERWEGVVYAVRDGESHSTTCGHKHYSSHAARECARLLMGRMNRA